MLTRYTTALKGALFAAVVALAAFFVVSGLTVGVIATTMPGCEVCHLRGEFAADTREGGHPGIECGRCHGADSVPTRFTFAVQTLFGMMLPVVPAEGRAVSAVEDRVCLSCHAGVITQIVVSRGYRIDHQYCAEGRRCTDCHSGTSHGESVRWLRTTQMEQCLECHPADHVRRTCDMCHDDRTPRERLGIGMWRVTHGAGWVDAHGMGDNQTCAGCHTREYCVRCHGIPLPHESGYLRIHSGPAISDAATCDRCHRIATYCDDCHVLTMPHSTAFTKIHDAELARAGVETCLACHAIEDCEGCHETHNWHLEHLGVLETPIGPIGEPQ